MTKQLSKAEEILDKHIGFKTSIDERKRLTLDAMKEAMSDAWEKCRKSNLKNSIAKQQKDQFIKDYFGD